jgi:hypothetical protein
MEDPNISGSGTPGLNPDPDLTLIDSASNLKKKSEMDSIFLKI